MSPRRSYASPPCMASEVDPAYVDAAGPDPEQARDVARWRRAERRRLAGLRDALGQAGRADVSERIGRHLSCVLEARGVGPGPRPMVIGIALSAARLPTIYPQPHDIPLDLIVTEAGVSAEKAATP